MCPINELRASFIPLDKRERKRERCSCAYRGCISCSLKHGPLFADVLSGLNFVSTVQTILSVNIRDIRITGRLFLHQEHHWQRADLIWEREMSVLQLETVCVWRWRMTLMAIWPLAHRPFGLCFLRFFFRSNPSSISLGSTALSLLLLRMTDKGCEENFVLECFSARNIRFLACDSCSADVFTRIPPLWAHWPRVKQVNWNCNWI